MENEVRVRAKEKEYITTSKRVDGKDVDIIVVVRNGAITEIVYDWCSRRSLVSGGSGFPIVQIPALIKVLQKVYEEEKKEIEG